MAGEFVIQCTTCGSRLKVRDMAAVGHILSCPKCNGMVLVQPPAGFELPVVPQEPAMIVQPQQAAHTHGAKQGDSSARETLSDSDFGDVDQLLDSAPPTATQRPHISRPAPPPPAELSGKAKSTAVAASDLPPESMRPVGQVAPDFTSPAVKRGRFIAMLVAASIMGVSLAIGVAYWFSSQKKATAPPTAASAIEPDTVPDITPEPLPVETETPEKLPSTAEKTIEPPEEKTTPQEIPPEKIAAPPMAVVEVPAKPPMVDPLDEIVDTNVPVAPANDPLKLADLRKFDKLLENNAANAAANAEKTVPPMPVPENATPAEPLPRPEMRKVNATARVADKFVKLDCRGRPLLDFLQVVSDYSTVPITLDPVALAWSRITPDQPLANQLSDISVLDALKQTLQPYRLEPVLRDNHLIITRPIAPRAIPYPCDGLASDKKQLVELESFVRALAAPEVWTDRAFTIKGEGTTLTIQATDTVHIQVLELLERLRVARGMPIKSKFPATMFSLETRSARIREKLKQTLTLNYTQPTPLVKMVRQLHQESGIHFLVDWYALAQEGWPTDSEASVHFDKTPLSEGLLKLLHPMDLDFRVIDDQTIQITSRRQLETIREIELYRVGDLLSSDETERSLADRIGAVMGERVVLRFDVPSRAFFVLASQPDQQKLAGLLESWRRTAEK
jgi:hypothetical protein